MKSYRKELWFEIPKCLAFLYITPEVKRCLTESGIKEGLVLCNAMHISASVFINDDESGLHQDFERWLEKLAPEKPYAQYAHNGAEDNADAHLKRTLMGRKWSSRSRLANSILDPGNRFFMASSTATAANGCW